MTDKDKILKNALKKTKIALALMLDGIVWTRKDNEMLALRIKDIVELEEKIQTTKNESEKRFLKIQRRAALDHIAILAILKTKLIEEKAKEELKGAIIKIVAEIIKQLVIALITKN